MSQARFKELISATIVFSLLLALVALRAGIVDRNIGKYIACPGCFHSSVFQADMVMFWLIACILLAAGLIRPRLPGRLLHLAIGLLMIVYIADLLVFRLFNSRLLHADVALFISERAAVWDQFTSGVGGLWIAALILLSVLGLLVFLFLMPPARARSVRIFLSVMLIFAVTAGTVLESPPFVNDWATINVFKANLATSERVNYSAGFEKNFSTAEKVELQQHDSAYGSQSGRNVIVVVLESWSVWHSRQFGGAYDWTPKLDAAAQRGLRFSNFHSIGFSTSNGLVGILGGQKIWSPFLHLFRTTSFHSMWGIDRTLPRLFSESAYETAFLTTGPLSLYRKGEWMSDLGFHHVEGNEHPAYANEKRYAFGAPSDRALYRRGLHWMQAARSPYLMVLETVTTHQPYVDPDSRERSLEKAMRYADRAFGEFLDELDTFGFFEQGMLVVVSDHRSMTPVSAAEIIRLGTDAFSRVPAFIIGADAEPGSSDGRVLSQSDLVPSFEWWLTGTVRLGPHDAVMLDASATTKCAFHSRGDQRGLLEVVCPEGRGQVRLEGDLTRFVQSIGFDEDRKHSILDVVANERLTALYRHRQVE